MVRLFSRSWVLGCVLAISCGGSELEATSTAANDDQSVQQAAKACAIEAACIQGYMWNNHSCRCEKPKSPGGPSCGQNSCGAGSYSCNASCGICAHIGAVCIQEFCSPIQ